MDAGELLAGWSRAQQELWVAERELMDARREDAAESRTAELQERVRRRREACEAAWREAVEALARGGRTRHPP